jgi:sec-independent protein translocase protein TatA
MPEVGITGLIVLLIVALLVFGPKRLPEIGRSLGRGMREFKDSISGDKDRDEEARRPELSASAAPPLDEPVGVTQPRSDKSDSTA